MSRAPLILASASPRRRALLESLGLTPIVVPPTVDERPLEGETPEAHVVRLARAKADAVLGRRAAPEALILAADTTVASDGRIFGKPDDDAQALDILRALAGREHDVITACRLVASPRDAAATRVVTTRVRFAPWDEDAARWYVGTGEPHDKAGAYGIQGYGVLLTDGISGSWSNVVGLPLETLPGLFAEVGDDFFARLPHSLPSAGGMEGGEPG